MEPQIGPPSKDTGVAIEKVEKGITPTQLATAFAASGYFPDVRKISQAIVKIIAGQELGLGPIASVNGIHFIEGALTPGSNVMASLVKRSGIYDYRVLELTDLSCTVRFLRKIETGEWEPFEPDSVFTISDAKRAGLVKPRSGWEKYPRNMLFARAMSNGFRWHTPQLAGGFPLYDPSEFGSVVEGEYTEGEEVEYPPAAGVFADDLPAAAEREAAIELDLGAVVGPGIGAGGRVKNQWESEVMDQMILLGLTPNRYSATAILNQSPFMEVPVGQLALGNAAAWFICWTEIKAEIGEDVETPERGKIARAAWADPARRARFDGAAVEILARQVER